MSEAENLELLEKIFQEEKANRKTDDWAFMGCLFSLALWLAVMGLVEIIVRLVK